MTPADCNLRGLPFMPLMVTQVLQSETFGLSTGDEFKAAFALWCASWMEVPAASLPSDDRMLEFLSRSKNWKKVKAIALRGWVLCADGRLYHPVIAANANDAWEKRTEYRDKEGSKNERQQRWRDQCKQLAGQLRGLGITPPKGASLEKLKALLLSHGVDTETSTDVDAEPSTVDAGEIGKTETVKRQRQLTSKTEDSGGGTVYDQGDAPRVAPLPTREDPPMSNDPAIQLSVRLRRLGVNAMFTHPAVQDWVKRQVPPEILDAAVARAREAKGTATIPPNYLVGIVNDLLNPPPMAEAKPAREKADDWYRSKPGIERKGRELGMTARGTESYDDFKERIFARLREQGANP